MLTVELLGGLCNRLQALDSAITLSRAIHKPLRAIWALNRNLNCRFEELFYPPADLRIAQPSNFEYKCIKTMQRLRLHHLFFDKAIPRGEEKRLIRDGYDFEALSNYRSVYFPASTQFYRPEHPFSEFKPVSSIQSRISNTASAFSPHTIGIHIRRTDNASSIRYSPTWKFVEYMTDAIRDEPRTDFFVATDSLEEELLLRNEFGDRILSYSKETLDRDKAAGVKDALVDLVCLSMTKKLYGSSGSSFSSTAAQIGNIPLVVVKHSYPPAAKT